MKVNPITYNYNNYKKINKQNNNKHMSTPSGLDNRDFGYQAPLINFTGLHTSGIVKNAAGKFIDKIDSVIHETVSINGGVKTILTYNDSNAGRKIISKLEQDLYGNFISLTRYKYIPNSENNHLISTYNFDANNNFLWETKYKYKDNVIAETSDYDALQNLLHKTRYNYYNFNGQKRLAFITDIDPDGNPIKQVSFRLRDKRFNPADFSNYSMSQELFVNKKYINNFINSHRREFDFLNPIFSLFREETPYDFNILGTYDVSGRLKSITLIRIPSDDVILTEQRYVSEQGVLFDDNLNPRLLFLNLKYPCEGGVYKSKIDDDWGASLAQQRIYHPDGRLISVYDTGFAPGQDSTVATLTYFAQDGKTANISYSKSSSDKFAICREYYPDGSLKKERSNYMRYGANRNEDELMELVRTFNSDGKFTGYNEFHSNKPIDKPVIAQIYDFSVLRDGFDADKLLQML